MASPKELTKEEFKEGLDLIKDSIRAVMKDYGIKKVDDIKTSSVTSPKGFLDLLVFQAHSRPNTPQPVMNCAGRIANFADVCILHAVMTHCGWVINDIPELKRWLGSDGYKDFMENKGAYGLMRKLVTSRGAALGQLKKDVYKAFSAELGVMEKSNPKAVAFNNGMNEVFERIKYFISAGIREVDTIVSDMGNIIFDMSTSKDAARKWTGYDMALAFDLLLRYAEQQLGKPLPDKFRSEKFKQLLVSDYYEKHQWIDERTAKADAKK